MEDYATIRRIKLEQCVQLATFQTDATQVKTIQCAKHCLDFVKTLDQGHVVKLTVELGR